jgi:hypothetical protein
MPLGGWARLSNIKNEKDQKWNMYLPKPVLISVDKFMEKDFEGKNCWYEVTKGKCIQGLLAQYENEYRLYVLTVDPEDLMNCHYRWPNRPCAKTSAMRRHLMAIYTYPPKMLLTHL